MKKLVFVLVLFYSSLEAKNAGILPYTIIKGKVHFLLGEEGHGHYKNQWADEGGGEKPQDQNTKKTAIREFTEETGAVFAKFQDPNANKKNAFKLSNEYISQRMSQGINNPGKKIFYTMYLAHVDYISPQDILKNPYKLSDNEKVKFEWVDAQLLLTSLQRQNLYLKDYYDSLIKKRHSKFNPHFGDKAIRRPFATYFIDSKTNNIIRSIIGLPQISVSTDYESESEEEKSEIEFPEEEEGWIESYEPYEEEKETEWVATPPRKPYRRSQPYKTYTTEPEELHWVPDQPSLQKDLERKLGKLEQKLRRLQDALPRKRR